MIARHGVRLLLALAIAGTVACDRVTKYAAVRTLAGRSGRSFLGDTVRLEYAENTGGFLSLGATLPAAVRATVFTAATGIMLLAMAAVVVRSRWTGWAAIGAALFLTGGASNWLDRVIRGSVVDFMNVGFGPLRTGIFNVADMAILAGLAICLIARRGPAKPL
jgi:signal peptidase II